MFARRLAVVALLAMGCGNQPAQPAASASASASVSATATASDEPEPSEPDETATAEPTGPVPASTIICLPRRICDCVTGCSGIEAPRDQIKQGLTTEIVSGTDKGQRGTLANAPAADGGELLVVGPYGSAPPICDFLCKAEDTRPISRTRCATGCRN